MSNVVLTQDNWCAVSGSEDLETNQVIQVTISDQEIAVWRDSEGQVHACSNFCVHRGMRLSHGFIKDDHLVCRYHGWRYRRDGQCDYIPAMPNTKPPSALCTKTYRASEAIGFIWVNQDEQENSPPTSINHEPGGETLFCRSLYANCSYETALDKLQRSIFIPHKLLLELPSDNWITGESDLLSNEELTQQYRCQWVAGKENALVEYTCHSPAPGVLSITANNYGESLILALQPVGDNKVGIHISVRADSAESALRLHYANWAKQVRWMLENDQNPGLTNRPWLSL